MLVFMVFMSADSGCFATVLLGSTVRMVWTCSIMTDVEVGGLGSKL